MNTEAIDLLIKTHPKLSSSRSQFEAMQAGAYCIHRSWGLGLITAYDDKDGKLIIDFEEGKKGHAMDPVFCVGRLEILNAQNLIVRHRKNPEEIEEMVKKSPADVIVEVLAYCPEQSAVNSEVEKQLNRLLGPTRYKKWWTVTKKLLVKDPRIAVPGKKTDPYILRDEPVKAEEEILEEFFATQAPKKQIALAEKLLILSISHEEIKDHLPDILQNLTSALQQTRILNLGERLHGLWVRNDLARFIHEDPNTLEPTSDSIIEEMRDHSELAEQIPATYYKRFLELICRVYPDRWERVVFDLLKNSSGKFTNECINFLIENELNEAIQGTLQRWLNEQNVKGPIIYWIIKNRNSRKYSHLLHDLITPQLFNAILYAIDYEALQNVGVRRIQLADVLSDDIELIPELLSQADPETARDLATTLILNQGFEDLSKRSLLARFIKQFPMVQSIVSGEYSDDENVLGGDEQLIVSKESFERYKSEYEILITKKIPENKRAIAIAREHGDLRENAEYKMARQDQDALLARKSHMELELGNARISDFTDAPEDTVGVGNVVTLTNAETGETVTYSILGAWDSNPDENILSYKTPLGQSLISKHGGDTVKTVIANTETIWNIEQIARWVDLHPVTKG